MKRVTQEKWNRVLKKQRASLVVQLLRLHTSSAWDLCLTPVWGIRSHMLYGVAKKKKKNTEGKKGRKITTVALGLSNDSGHGGSLFRRTSLLSEYFCQKLVQTTALIQTQIMGNVSPASI